MPNLIDRLVGATLLQRDELLALVRSAPHRYKVYQIPKRKSGQLRTIAQPAREVKLLQYWVMENILSKCRLHSAATAYRKGRSIADNARRHRKGSFILKMDFKDFFPSIKAAECATYLRKNFADLDQAEIRLLCRILFWRPKGTTELRLSIGAPSSPLLSNILMYDFDHRVASKCARLGVAYTRYADDLTFSSPKSQALMATERHVLELCATNRAPALRINDTKTVRVSKRESRRITGLVITNDRAVSLGREYKRRVRAAVHHFAAGTLKEMSAAQLSGLLAYINSVEPDFIIRLTRKYGTETLSQIRRST